jgi:TPR repeat protein
MMNPLMKGLTRRTVAVCLVAVLPFAAVTGEVLAADFDKPVFEFQSKLANQGNAKAQYFLAQMYEQGRGTAADAEQAKHWYEQAKQNGYIPPTRVVAAK